MTHGGGKCRLGLMEMLDSLSPKEALDQLYVLKSVAAKGE